MDLKTAAVKSVAEILDSLNVTQQGLTESEVQKRQKRFGKNIINEHKTAFLPILTRQFTTNPLIIVLASATLISYLLGQTMSSYYIFLLIIVSILFGFWNEFSAEKTVDDLLKKISLTALVERGGEKKEIPVSQLAVGDIIYLSPGSIVPADLRIIEARNLEINESSLTGEAQPQSKTSEVSPTPSRNIGFMGTNVENGSGRGAVIGVGQTTEFGRIAKTSTFVRPTTEFQKGLAQFGNLIIKVIIVLTVVIFAANSLFGRPIIESLLFALAIAVGLTPELLPVIVTVTLSHGAGRLAKKHVVVKRLAAVENLGNMDILCTDKTGTLTEGKIEVAGFFPAKKFSEEVLLKSAVICNQAVVHHEVIGDAIDKSIWEYALKHKVEAKSGIVKLDEEPFDFTRRLMFTAAKTTEGIFFIVKGAPESVLAACQSDSDRESALTKFRTLSRQGLRIVAVALKRVEKEKSFDWKDAQNLEFVGFITFSDSPKKTAIEALQKLKSLKVEVKVITGDNEVVTGIICGEVGMAHESIVLGEELERLNETELKNKISRYNIFARVNPEQKLRIIKILQNLGHTVGYLGDGVNDVPALHNADVGLSVNSGADVAKDAASVVLLRKGLGVIADGIVEGRKTFNNTIKYILMSTSSNFGNMFSAAGASLLLPFLPMTPVQILLTNGLYDLSQMSLPTDNVDEESLLKPRHWNIDFIKKYMIFFGPISSIYDYLTFGLMIFVFHANQQLFQTGWFIESVATEILVVFIIRTSRTPFFKSRPGRWLLLTCLTMVGIGLYIPFSFLASSLGLVRPPRLYFLLLIFLTTTYLLIVEGVKNRFLKKYTF
ncbi:MAG: magnesium-translocating P-type ATPase [Patescibacteria group bacterium]|nr:magnesium-translocating P-type ATPase [Patescibacteria group bacterium]